MGCKKGNETLALGNFLPEEQRIKMAITNDIVSGNDELIREMSLVENEMLNIYLY